jgi:hypothetical protein
LRIARKLLCGKSTIAVFALIIIAEELLNEASLFQVLPELLAWTLVCGLGTMIWALFYAAFGAVVWYAALRNIPIIISGFMFCISVSILLALFFIFLMGHVHPLDVIFTELIKVTVLMTLGMIVVLIAHQDTIMRQLNTEHFEFPVWKRCYVNDPKQRNDMPDVLREHILFIRTANQYIEVNTPNEKHELRMSLTKAETFLDDAIGTRVHRSHWVRNTEMKTLTYKNGNPFIELYSGPSLPIGRNMVDLVKDILTAHSENRSHAHQT